MPRLPCAAVVPTLGLSPDLEAAVGALHEQGLEVWLVTSTEHEAERRARATLAERVLTLPGRPSFSAATNAGIAASEAPFVATVNDDVVIEPGWAQSLLAELQSDDELASVQGVNLRLGARAVAGGDDQARVDGLGLGWSRRWQAVQVGRDAAVPERDRAPLAVYGVSATAALWRRSALDAVGRQRGDGRALCEALGSYYEDVEIAGRLRQLGWHARSLASARAWHRESTTGRRLGWRRWAWIHGNRWLVLADLLGRAFWARLPAIAARDLVDLGAAVARGDAERAFGILGGAARVLHRLPRFVRAGAPRLPVARLRPSDRGITEGDP